MAYRHRVKVPRLQARIFLPEWFVKVVRPGKEIQNDTIQMHVPLDMSKIDIKNYMEKIYNIPVARVHTRIQTGKWKTTTYRNDAILQKTKDIKVAYVQLKEGTFEFPDLFPETSAVEVDEPDETAGESKSLVEQTKEAAKTGDWFNM